MEEELESYGHNLLTLCEDDDENLFHEIYVGNVPQECTPCDLKSIFQSFGDVLCVSSIKKSNNYCFAFVAFKNTEDALRAVESKHLDYCNKRLKISRARYQYRSIRSNGKKVLNDNLVEPASVADLEINDDDMVINGDINLLNDDCLLHIFEMLDLNIRLQIESVCKRWNRLCNRLWNKQRSLCMNMVSWDSWDYVLTTQFLRNLLIRCGNSLTHLDLSGKTYTLNVRTLQIIANNCPSLKKLNISGLHVTQQGAKALGRKCHLIQELHMEACTGLKDSVAQLIFEANQSLEVLNLAKNADIKGSCLKSLSISLRELNLTSCISLRSTALIPHLQRLHNLVSLNIDCCTSVGNNTLKDIIAAVPNLQHLSCSNYMPALSHIGLNFIHNLKHLRSLNLVMNASVCDETLKLISKGCDALYSLDISCCGERDNSISQLTEEGIKSLANLPNLRLLTMSYNSVVTNLALEHLATSHHLEQLQCRGCPNLSDIGCKAVIQHCHKLVDLDVSGCELITNLTISTAIEEMKKRPPDEKLFLTLGGTSVNLETVSDLPSNLVVNFLDLCVKHLRPDFYDNLFTSDDEIDEMDQWYISEDEEDWLDDELTDEGDSIEFLVSEAHCKMMEPFFLF